MLKRERLPCWQVNHVVGKERHVLDKILGFALPGHNDEYRPVESFRS